MLRNKLHLVKNTRGLVRRAGSKSALLRRMTLGQMAFARSAGRIRALCAAGVAPSEAFANVNDDLWLWANTRGYRRFPELRAALPPLPDESLQLRFTGSSGDRTLLEAHDFYRLVRTLADLHHGSGFVGCKTILEFGCGWGRITRWFSKDRAREQLIGIDCLEEAISICKDTNPWATFYVVDPYPPTPIADSSVDLVYLYSVFSHLSEDAHLAWLTEFGRVLRPGGILIATTRGRDFIAECASVREQHPAGPNPAYGGALTAFRASAKWRARYDSGEFCFDPVGGGEGLDAGFFGETLIPKGYVEREWSGLFELVDYVSDRRRCGQDVIVARKRDKDAA